MELIGAAATWLGVNWASALLALATSALAIFALLAVIGYVASWRSLRETAKARQTTVFVEIARRWEDREMLEIRASIYPLKSAAEFQAHYQDLKANNPYEWLKLKRLANFFEDLGVFESLQSIDMQWIEESLGSMVYTYWKLWELAVTEDRESDKTARPDSALLYENWQALALEIEKRRQRKEYHHPRQWRHIHRHY
jgi:hypothetical protein